MQVMLTWSGPKSRGVAEALRMWIPRVIPGISPWVSSQDIPAGGRWLADLSKQLQKSSFGITCLTFENQSNQWISFEAGALSMQLRGRICPYLLDVGPEDLSETPFSQFQMAAANKEGTRKLINSLNVANIDDAASETTVAGNFELHWPDLNQELERIRQSPGAVFTRDDRRGSRPYLGRISVLVVDDESSQREDLSGMLRAWGMATETASDGSEALAKLDTADFDVIVTDLNMPHVDGFELLRRLQEAGDSTPTIVLTAFGSIETAVNTVHTLGAFWFLAKPISAVELVTLVWRAAAYARVISDKRYLERELSYRGSLGQLVGTSPQMQAIFALLQRAGRTNACVLITGESGTGKKLVARTVHALGTRRQGPFIGMQTQAKLLRTLEDSTVRRLGGKSEFEVDVRVVAATKKVPEEAVRGGHLREDLFYRLNVFHIHLPPLRERREDIPLIAEALLNDLNRKHECRVGRTCRRRSWRPSTAMPGPETCANCETSWSAL